MGPGVMIYIPSFIKIVSSMQKLIWWEIQRAKRVSLLYGSRLTHPKGNVTHAL
jgi:hypothetical protein